MESQEIPCVLIPFADAPIIFRYDGLIDAFRAPSTEPQTPVKAIGLQVVLEHLAQLASTYTKSRISALLATPVSSYAGATSKRSFGSLAPRRCDVYVVSTPTHAMSLNIPLGVLGPGSSSASKLSGRKSSVSGNAPTITPNELMLESRLRLTARLWRAGISADVMYDDGSEEKGIEGHLENCLREGIL